MSPDARLQAVVPTLGKSPWLVPCLESVRREGGEALELVLVYQGAGEALSEAARRLADRVLELPRAVGFAAAANRGIAATSTPWVLLLNDDAVLEPGWLAALRRHQGTPRLAALQGVNLLATDRSRADGCGLAWSSWWQAVQRCHGASPPAPGAPPREIFGVSATAALLRREALEQASSEGAPFDERLGTYYEDVELAVRLRRLGWSALLVPSARALHAGGVSAPRRHLALLYGNRYAVVADLLGTRFWRSLPALWLRDLADFARQPRRGAGIVAGWARAARLVPCYARRGAPDPDLEVLRLFGEGR